MNKKISNKLEVLQVYYLEKILTFFICFGMPMLVNFRKRGNQLLIYMKFDLNLFFIQLTYELKWTCDYDIKQTIAFVI